MHGSETRLPGTERPRVTVAALAERAGRFLFVLERTDEGRLVINQPAGHLERGESLVEAVVREAHEETGWAFVPDSVVGVYQWQHSHDGPNYVRFAISGNVTERDESPRLDEGIEDVLWLTWDQLNAESERLRSPLVLEVVRDYLAGVRYPIDLIKLVQGPVNT